MKCFLGLSAVTCLSPTFLLAASIEFNDAWREQGFLRFSSNDYQLRGSQLGVSSNGTVSILWRPVEDPLGTAANAAWQWRVDGGVPATDLTVKGGDDRNLALYFVFVDAASAESLRSSSARRVLRHPNTRALVYVWGGEHKVGSVLASPYSSQLRTKVLRGAGTGQFSENVNLRADFKRAFGTDAGVLIGLAVSADSDDTDTKIRAAIANLQLQ